MIKNYENIVRQSEIKELLDFTFTRDNYFDESSTNIIKIITKSPNSWPNSWPNTRVSSIINNIISRLDFDPVIDRLLFWHQKITNFGLHADCGDGNQKTLDKNILIPLDFDIKTPCTTVVFKNKWFGPDVKFYKSAHTLNEDISKCEGYDVKNFIDEKIYKKYLKHVDKELLKGLKVEEIYNWNLGDVFTFDRQHIHCSGYCYAPKTSILIFTNKKE